MSGTDRVRRASPDEVLWAAAGHAHVVFRTDFDELVTLTQGTPAVVGD